MSPRFRPALASGLSGWRLTISAPSGRAMPSEVAISGVTSCSSAPSHGRLMAAPPFSAVATTVFTMLVGMAKPMPMEPPRAREDGRVDADQLALHVDERAAGVAGVDGRIGLDEELVVADAHPGAGECRDDAAGHRLAHAEGIADGEHEVTHLERIGIAQRQGGKLLVRHVDLEHGEVGALVGEQHLGLELALVGQRHLDVGGVGDDVVVGDDQPIRDRRSRPSPANSATRSRGRPKLPSSPKKRRKNGSSKKPLASWSCTSLRCE